MGCYADNMTDRDISGVHIKFEADNEVSKCTNFCASRSMYKKLFVFKIHQF